MSLKGVKTKQICKICVLLCIFLQHHFRSYRLKHLSDWTSVGLIRIIGGFVAKKKSVEADQKQISRPGLHSFFHSDWLPIVIIAVAAFALFGSFIFSDNMLFGSDTLSGLDSRVFLRDALNESKQFPLWFNTRLGGMPTIDALFGDAMYLPSLFFYWILPIHRALGFKLIFHVLLAGIFFYLLLRKGFKLSKPVSLVGALLYMLNPQFVSHVYPGHDGKMFVIAWLPYIAWRMKTLLDRPNLINSTLLALGIAMSLFTSHIQMTYFVLWGLFLYWVFALFFQWREHKSVKRLAPMAAYFWVAVIIGLGAAFIQFYPSYMYVQDALSVRGGERGFEHAASWALHWPEVFSLIFPDFAGFNVEKIQTYWSENAFKLNSEYAGSIALLFAVFGIVFRPSKWRYFWGGIAVLAVAFGLATHTPLFGIAYHIIPGVSKFRAASMIMFWFAFALVLLASFSFNDVWSGRFDSLSDEQRKKKSRGLLIAAAVITVVTLLFSSSGFIKGIMGTTLADPRKAQFFDSNYAERYLPSLWATWLFITAAIGMFWAVLNKKAGRATFLVVIAVIAIIDVLRIDTLFIKTINPRPYFHSAPEIQQLAREFEEEPFRSYILPGTYKYQNSAGVHHIEGVGDFHDNELRWYREFRGDQSNGNYLRSLISSGPNGNQYLVPEKIRQGNAYLNIANVKYIVTRQGNGSVVTLQNNNALGRISFVPGYVVMEESAIKEALANGGYDYRSRVALMEEPQVKPKSSPAANGKNQFTVEWEKYTPNVRNARISTDRDGFLRISEVWYPGWKIFVDGEEVEPLRADLAWMAIPISAGEHQVEIRATSPYLAQAKVISFPIIIALIVYWGVYAFLKRKRPSDSKESKS